MKLTPDEIINLESTPLLIAEAKENFSIILDNKKDINYIRELGVYSNISNEEYHADKNFISRSAIMDFDKSPHTYWAKHLNPKIPKETTKIKWLGSAFHTLILEPHLFNEEYVVLPPRLRLKEVGRAVYDRYNCEIKILKEKGKIILSKKENKVLYEMHERFFNNKEATELIFNSRIEHSFFWKDKTTGLLLKSRPDILQPNIIIDLKTTSDASPEAFQREMIKYGYHIQLAMIRDGIEAIEGVRINNFINIVVENKYPYNMAINIIDEEVVDYAEKKYKKILVDIKHAIDNNTFTDYGIQRIGLPKWAL